MLNVIFAGCHGLAIGVLDFKSLRLCLKSYRSYIFGFRFIFYTEQWVIILGSFLEGNNHSEMCSNLQAVFRQL